MSVVCTNVLVGSAAAAAPEAPPEGLAADASGRTLVQYSI